MALSKLDGWVGYSGGEKLLRLGEEFADDHALVKERPDLFEVEQEPEPEQPPATERKKPGPKPGSSRTKPQT